jgi:hypothetical protein
MTTVLWEIKRSWDLPPEALKRMKEMWAGNNGWMVEKVMNRVSDGLAKNRRGRDCEKRN